MGAKYDFGKNWHDEFVLELIGMVIRSACIDHIKIEQKLKKTTSKTVKKNLKRELYRIDLFFESELYKLACPSLTKEDLLGSFYKHYEKKPKVNHRTKGRINE